MIKIQGAILATLIIASSWFVDNDAGSVGPPSQWADIIRAFVFASAGFCVGILFLIVYKFTKIRKSNQDTLMRPIGGLCVSYTLLIIFAALEVFHRFGHVYLTWRTPYAFVAFLVGAPSLLMVKRRLSRAMQRAADTDADVKLTMTDTGKPGADIDMIRPE